MPTADPTAPTEAHLSLSVTVLVAPDVPVMRLAAALAYAGLTIRRDRVRGRLVIRQAGRLNAIAPELAGLLNRLSMPAS